jgi:hypothetical protein
MADIAEHHEIRVRGRDHTILFIADSADGRLVIRQEPHGKSGKNVCAITLSDPEELRSFFKGLRRILASLGHDVTRDDAPTPAVRTQSSAAGGGKDEDREAVVAQARQKNPLAFAPWTEDEERQVAKRHKAGESVEAIARAHKRSPRAIGLRLQRLGLLPPD